MTERPDLLAKFESMVPYATIAGPIYRYDLNKEQHEQMLNALRALAQSSPMSFFSENVDAWGAVEWFDRLATAVRQQDAAVLAKDDITMEICRNVAASSAMRLVRDYGQQVRAALAASSVPSGQKRDDRLEELLCRLAGLNDLEGIPREGCESAAFAALHECEVLAREALELLRSSCRSPGEKEPDPDGFDDLEHLDGMLDDREREG